MTVQMKSLEKNKIQFGFALATILGRNLTFTFQAGKNMPVLSKDIVLSKTENTGKRSATWTGYGQLCVVCVGECSGAFIFVALQQVTADIFPC